jgi:hypothetical protein
MANEDGAEVPPPKLQSLVTYCESKKIPLVVGTDANAHHTVWGSTDINVRGEQLLEFIISTSLEIANEGTKPTYVHANRREVLDLTLETGKLVQGWKVSDRQSLSDHRIIEFSLGEVINSS